MAGETEFEDILIKHGLLEDPQEAVDKEEQHVFDISGHCDDSENEDDQEDAFFEHYKTRRMAELQAGNEVAEISRPEFVQKVTEASKVRPVLVHLYNDSVEASLVLKRDIRAVSGQYPRISFVEILASRCIPDYPDSLVPTLLHYRHGGMEQKVARADPSKLRSLLDAIVDNDNKSNKNGSNNNNND